MFDEIGSEYWRADLLKGANNNIKNAVYTASGRSAQSLIIHAANIKNKRALLPAYTCQHIVEPFAWKGWSVDFYAIDKEGLTINLQSFEEKLALKPGCIIVQGYFGFPTAVHIIPYLKQLQLDGVVVIEDITHSFLNVTQTVYKEADYVFCSLRKWSGLSDGGYAISSKGEKLFVPENTMESFSSKRLKARRTKEEYVRNLSPETKKRFLELYTEAENLLDNDVGIYSMSEHASEDFKDLDLEFIRNARRTNFAYYLKNINCKYVEPIFKKLTNNECPIMFPVYIDKYRDELRSQLIKERVYCPVHWPMPIQLDQEARKNSEQIYDNIMSIPCDQRYTTQDLERVVELINSFEPEE